MTGLILKNNNLIKKFNLILLAILVICSKGHAESLFYIKCVDHFKKMKTYNFSEGIPSFCQSLEEGVIKDLSIHKNYINRPNSWDNFLKYQENQISYYNSKKVKIFKQYNLNKNDACSQSVHFIDKQAEIMQEANSNINSRIDSRPNKRSNYEIKNPEESVVGSIKNNKFPLGLEWKNSNCFIASSVLLLSMLDGIESLNPDDIPQDIENRQAILETRKRLIKLIKSLRPSLKNGYISTQQAKIIKENFEEFQNLCEKTPGLEFFFDGNQKDVSHFTTDLGELLHITRFINDYNDDDNNGALFPIEYLSLIPSSQNSSLQELFKKKYQNVQIPIRNKGGIFAISRFDYDLKNNKKKKRFDKVSIIDNPVYIRNDPYQVVAISVHLGDSTESGHFVTYTKANNGNWLKNDNLTNTATIVDNSAVKQEVETNGFVVTYARMRN